MIDFALCITFRVTHTGAIKVSWALVWPKLFWSVLRTLVASVGYRYWDIKWRPIGHFDIDVIVWECSKWRHCKRVHRNAAASAGWRDSWCLDIHSSPFGSEGAYTQHEARALDWTVKPGMKEERVGDDGKRWAWIRRDFGHVWFGYDNGGKKTSGWTNRNREYRRHPAKDEAEACQMGRSTQNLRTYASTKFPEIQLGWYREIVRISRITEWKRGLWVSKRFKICPESTHDTFCRTRVKVRRTRVREGVNRQYVVDGAISKHSYDQWSFATRSKWKELGGTHCKK